MAQIEIVTLYDTWNPRPPHSETHWSSTKVPKVPLWASSGTDILSLTHINSRTHEAGGRGALRLVRVHDLRGLALLLLLRDHLGDLEAHRERV